VITPGQIRGAKRTIRVVAALLHDIGRLALASKMPDKFCLLLASAGEDGREHFDLEEKLLGTSHAEIGAYLLGLWGIPDLAVEAIAHHHRPTRVPHTGFDSSVAIYVADLLDYELEVHPQDKTGAELAEGETLGVLPEFAEFRELAFRCCDKSS
jgi:HD-like signal output (HDOD) protein